ncbi:MAG: hypothetical protein GY839_08160 [candidate division Zixibacteria bacterium]|nr:hypothetical protein [candidate division Zixibacteria bacterium]
MPFKVAVDEENEIVQIRIWGLATRNDHLAARSEAAKLCDQRRFRKLLIDLEYLKIRKGISMMGCYRFGESLTQGILPIDIRIAHVMPGDPDARRAALFTTTVAKNRSGAIREFDTSTQAREWLLS